MSNIAMNFCRLPMYRGSWIGLWLVAVTGFAPFTVFGETQQAKIVIDNAYPPYMYGDSGRPAGLYYELIRKVFERAGIEIEVEAYPWQTALKLGAEGKAGIGGAYANKARRKVYDYSDPIYQETLFLYVRRGYAFPYSKLSDLKGKRVGVSLGWSYGDAFDRARDAGAFEVYETRDTATSHEALVLGKVDCIIADASTIAQLRKRQNASNETEKLATPVVSNLAYVIFAKQMNKKGLLRSFNVALQAMKSDGAYEQLVDAFMNTHPKTGGVGN